MATTGSGYVRPAMPMPADALPNHCLPQPSILRRGSSISPYASPLSSPSAERKGSYAFPSLPPLDVTGLDVNGVSPSASAGEAAGPSSLPPSPTNATTTLVPDGSAPAAVPGGGAPLGRRESAIHFAPLPELTEEDRAGRRSSAVSVGVASRSSMLSGPNAPPKKVPRVNSVSNDAWAAYKRGSVDSTFSNHSESDSTPDVVDQLASGVKSFWKRVRSSDASSKSSVDGASAATAAAQVNAAARIADRRGSAPVHMHHKPGTPFHHNPSPLHAIPDNSANPSRVPSPPAPGQAQKTQAHQAPPMMALPGGVLLPGAPQVQQRDPSPENFANRRVSAPVFSHSAWNHQRKNSNESLTSPGSPLKGTGSPVIWREGLWDPTSPRGMEHLTLAEEDEEDDGDEEERDEVEDQVKMARPATPPRGVKKHAEDEGKEVVFEEAVTVKVD